MGGRVGEEKCLPAVVVHHSLLRLVPPVTPLVRVSYMYDSVHGEVALACLLDGTGPATPTANPYLPPIVSK